MICARYHQSNKGAGSSWWFSNGRVLYSMDDTLLLTSSEPHIWKVGER